MLQFAAHQENGRLMGLVVEDPDWSQGDQEGAPPSYSAFVFESNTEGEKVGWPTVGPFWAFWLNSTKY